MPAVIPQRSQRVWARGGRTHELDAVPRRSEALMATHADIFWMLNHFAICCAPLEPDQIAGVPFATLSARQKLAAS